MKSRSSIILRNVASNWVGFGINAAVTLVLTPFVLRELGAARYGIWILTSSIIGYYGMLDLGFRAGVTQYLTRYLAVRDYERANQCLSSAVAVLGAVGAVVLTLSIGAASLAPRLFKLPPGMEREAFWCILIVGGSSAIQFGLQPFTAVFTATQRFDLANAIGVVTRVLTAIGIFVSLKAGFGLIGVSAATCSVSAIDYLIRWRVAHGLMPQLAVSLSRASMERVREIGAFGAWNFLMSLNSIVYQHVPNLLIGTMLPIAAVGYYALATGMIRQMNTILSTVPTVIYPAAAEMHVRGDERGLERLYHDGARLMMIVMLSGVLIAAFWANDFYRLWVGEKYLVGGQFPSVALLFHILLISLATTYSSSSIASQILTGAGRVRTVALALLCGSIVNLSLSLVLIRPYGLLGVATATVTASVLIDLVVMPVLMQRILGLSVLRFIRQACARPLAAAALQSLLFVFIRSVGRPEHWIHLVSQGAVAGLGSVVILAAIALNSDERRRFLFSPIRRVWRPDVAPSAAA